MKCIICGKELSGRQKLYCSNKCKMKSKKLQQKNLQMVPISAKNAPYDQLETMMVLAKKITNDVKDLKREIEDIKQIINKETQNGKRKENI